MKNRGSGVATVLIAILLAGLLILGVILVLGGIVAAVATLDPAWLGASILGIVIILAIVIWFRLRSEGS